MAEPVTLEDQFLEELRELYDAERRMIKAWPKLADAATTPELKRAFESHLGETETHLVRLEQIFGIFGQSIDAGTCKGMRGILAEQDDLVDLETDPWIRDAAIIASAQKAEHYEIASYGTLRAWADILGRPDVKQLIEFTLREEKDADATLTVVATQLNPRAASIKA